MVIGMKRSLKTERGDKHARGQNLDVLEFLEDQEILATLVSATAITALPALGAHGVQFALNLVQSHRSSFQRLLRLVPVLHPDGSILRQKLVVAGYREGEMNKNGNGRAGMRRQNHLPLPSSMNFKEKT